MNAITSPYNHYRKKITVNIKEVNKQVMRKFSSVQSLSRIWLFEIPWTAARQASLSLTNSQSLCKLMSVELVMPSSHLILCCPLLLLPSVSPSISVCSMSQLFTSRGQSAGAPASASVLAMNIQGWFPFGLTSLTSLQLKELSRVYTNTTVWSLPFFSTQHSLGSNCHIHI